MRKIYFAILLAPALAWAAPSTASDWFQVGANQYTLGNFEKAIDAFKRAFELETDENKRAAYVYNIAQAYRQSNDCVKAHFFYKRFLALKASETVKPLTDVERKNVENFIRDLEPCAQQAQALGKRPPEALQGDSDTGNGAGSRRPPSETPVREPGKQVATVTAPGAGREGEQDNPETEVEPGRAMAPHLLSARLTGGASLISLGKFDVPAQATFALVAGYPIAVNDQLTIDVGAGFTFTPVSLQPAPEMGARAATARMMGLVADAGVTYEVAPKFGVRGDVGLGALFLDNVSRTVLTNGRSTSGALPMLHVRAALSGDYAITPNVVLTLTPIAFTYSPPVDGLDESIDSITSLDFLVGLGYRM